MIKAPPVQAVRERPPVAALARSAALAPPGAERLLLIAEQQAASLLTIARHDAMKLCQAAEAEARAIGYSAGHAEGFAAGRMEALRGVQEEGRRIVEAAQAEAQRVLEGAEERVGLLACEIASHLIGTELRQSPETIERAVAQTLAAMGVEGDISIEVATADYEQAVQSVGAWRDGLGSGADIRVMVDPALPRGGYRVLGPSGAVERNWQDGLKAIAQAFEEVARRGV